MKGEALEVNRHGEYPVKAGSPEESLVYQRIVAREPEDLMPAAVALGEEIAANPASTLATIKRTIYEDMLLTEMQAAEPRSTQRFNDARKTVEHREALLAIREKRKPRFHDPEHMARVAQLVSDGR